MQHHIPADLPRKLDLRVPPEKGAAAEGYRELLRLLEDLGTRLDREFVQTRDLRAWEQAVIRHLHDGEIDRLMHVPEDSELDTAGLAERRWGNLRSILLARKGLKPGSR